MILGKDGDLCSDWLMVSLPSMTGNLSGSLKKSNFLSLYFKDDNLSND